MNIVDGVDTITRTVKNYITSENVTNGLLEDVETIIRSVQNETPIDTPAVWIVQHPTIQYQNEKYNNLSRVKHLSTTFEFVCVEYDEDLEVAENKGLNLATRVGQSIMKNFNKVKDLETDPDSIFLKVEFETLYPVGFIQIEGKAKKIPATSIIFNFIYPVKWLVCH